MNPSDSGGAPRAVPETTHGVAPDVHPRAHETLSLSTRTRCAVCGQPIRGVYACPAPSYEPRHLRCVYAEMAVTDGAHAEGEK